MKLSEFCKGCINFPCGDIEDNDTIILNCDYKEVILLEIHDRKP